MFEADDVVGGIARTVVYDGYRFDLGGHRFFTKLPAVQRFWEEILGDDFLERPRLSRIYYHGRYFAYPLQAKDVIARLGARESILCTLSYLRSRLTRRRGHEKTFEEWVETRFGRRLYDAFFGPYTEKVWGIPGSEIRAEWAAQRIRNFSLARAALAILGLRGEHTTLIERFHYPRLGPGQMWEEVRRRTESGGVPVKLGHRARAVRHEGGRVTGVAVEHDGGTSDVEVDGLLSSIPLSELVLSLDPPPPHGGDRCGTRTPLPRPLSGRPRHRRRGAVPGQLDLPPRSRNARGTRAELRRLEPGDGQAGHDLPRGGVLLLRRGRDLGAERGGRRASCHR